MTEVTKDVELARIVKPKFISLVGLPANQVAFKIVRDDKGVPMPHFQRKRGTRRSENLLISVMFEPDTTDEEISNTMSDWGVTQFTIETTDSGRLVRCADAGDQQTMAVKLSDGVTATILKPISIRSDAAKPFVAVSEIEFAKDYFPTIEDCTEWCRSNGVDFSVDAVQNGDQQIVVRRGVKVEQGEETRRLEIDDGVKFVVVRAEVQQVTLVPPNFVTVVNDTAYGSWGWGQLDFAAYMADVEFCDAAREALCYLRDIAEQIMFYNDAPVAVRKTLIAQASLQFSDYIGTLMDALPARVVIATRSHLEKEQSMSKDKGVPAQPAARTDPATPATPAVPAAPAPAATPAPAAAAPAADAPITRGDVEAMITAAVGGLSAQLTEITAKLTPAAPAQRADGTADPAAPAASAAAPATPAAPATDGETLREVLRSVKEIGEQVKGVSERVQSLEGTTSVRSDATDPKQTTARKDVFKGIFGGGKAA